MALEYAGYGLLDGPERVILHGCNARGKFGAGVAKSIADAHPRAKVAYLRAWEEGRLLPGNIIWSSSGPWRIGNAVTQDRYGREHGVRYVRPEAVRQTIRTMDVLAQRSREEAVVRDWFNGCIERVAMPRIGAGLGGGDWEEIETVIREEAKHFTVVVCIPVG